MQTILLWLIPLFPALAALVLGLLPLKHNSRGTHLAAAAALAVNFALCLWLMFLGDHEVTLFWLGENLPIALRSDLLGRLFLLLCGGMWLNSGVFSFGYLPHEGNEQRYFVFYLLSIAAINAICLSATPVTMYLFFELMTLLSMALVVHSMTREAVAAGIKYLLYSIAGAMMGLFGIFVFSGAMETPFFAPGGALGAGAMENGSLILWATLITIIGFATKAGMFPMHGWLPTAHPIAPAPASAVLSGVITKMGVLCVVRVLFYVVGAGNLRGTFVQTTLLILALCTVFMGSMMAFRTTGFKKRLAYSTVSQVSYILFGLFLMTPQAFAGAVEHMYFHSVMKNALFLCAGAVILKTGRTEVSQLRGMGKQMPLTMWCFTIAGLGLVGVPPLSGFFSKWELAQGSLSSGIAVFSWLGPVVLLISALLTAGYLLPISIDAFFPGHAHGEEAPEAVRCEVGAVMAVPLVVLTVLTVLMGMFPGLLADAAHSLAALLM
ncbi:MAG: proton-conducting membrane transporter [Clostridiales bacterium]|nr:proton-conducting membrane transporter [Clostridiales bacterium]